MREQNQSFWHHLYSYPIVRILIVAFVGGFTAFAVSHFLPATYCSESKLLLQIVDPQLTNYQLSELTKNQAKVLKDYAESRDFLQEVLNRAGVTFKPEELEDGWKKKFRIDLPA